jgi:tetratricopeptide (TPR) repeat protein
LDEAEASLTRAVEVFTFVVGRDNGYTVGARRDAAALKLSRGKHREVIAELEAVLALMLEKDGTTNQWVNQTRHALAKALMAVGRPAPAHELLDEGIEMSANDPKRQIRIQLLQTRAELAREEGRFAEAMRDLELARQISAGLSGSQDQLIAGLLATRGEVLLSTGRVDDAIGALTEADTLLAASEADVRKPERLRVAIAIAAADVASGRPVQARDSLRKLLADINSQPRPEELWLLRERAHHGAAAASLALGEKEAACRSLDTALQIRRRNSTPGDLRLQRSEAAFAKQKCARSA